LGHLTIAQTDTVMASYSKYVHINMELVPLSLFWEGFPQDFGVFLWKSIHEVRHWC